MRDHSPLKYMTVDVNLCNFCHKLDVYSVNFMVTFQICLHRVLSAARCLGQTVSSASSWSNNLLAKISSFSDRTHVWGTFSCRRWDFTSFSQENKVKNSFQPGYFADTSHFASEYDTNEHDNWNMTIKPLFLIA